jgi:murein DD-endopeptidase MepM/ murein hydrolase activator NlpD
VITVKKNKFTEFFKGKGYYVLLFVGVLAIAAVAFVGSQLSSNNNEDQNYVDLNDTEDNIAAEDDGNQVADNNQVTEGNVNNEDTTAAGTNTNDTTGQEDASNDQVEYEDYSEGDSSKETAKANEPAKNTQATNKPDAVETTGTTVEANSSSVVNNLSFNVEKGLLWPVEGNVIMKYSMDHTIYYATLMQYKCNPAVIIDAEVGTEVKAAATGVVSSIDTNNEETGYTVTMNIGNGYSVVYGQLNEDSVSLKVGNKVNEGDVIGTIAEPTKYYSIEGSNLYFKVLENDQTVDPMLYLR